MANSYQLVAWTEKGQVRMIPSEVASHLHAELSEIDRLVERIRYQTPHERGDIFRVSQAYEKLAVRLQDMGLIEDAFVQLAQAAKCCLLSSEWAETEWGDVLCRPLQGRFFAMFCACKEMARKYPRLKYAWAESGLQGACNRVTHALRLYKADLQDC